MRKILLLLSLSLSAVYADERIIRFGNKTVSTGDSVNTLLTVAGEPAYKTDIVNKFNAKLGERWEYIQGNKTIKMIIESGRITDIQELR